MTPKEVKLMMLQKERLKQAASTTDNSEKQLEMYKRLLCIYQSLLGDLERATTQVEQLINNRT